MPTETPFMRALRQVTNRWFDEGYEAGRLSADDLLARLHAAGFRVTRDAKHMAAVERFNRIGDPDVGGPELDEVPF